jgi:hypothetical protein
MTRTHENNIHGKSKKRALRVWLLVAKQGKYTPWRRNAALGLGQQKATHTKKGFGRVY